MNDIKQQIANFLLNEQKRLKKDLKMYYQQRLISIEKTPEFRTTIDEQFIQVCKEVIAINIGQALGVDPLTIYQHLEEDVDIKLYLEI